MFMKRSSNLLTGRVQDALRAPNYQVPVRARKTVPTHYATYTVAMVAATYDKIKHKQTKTGASRRARVNEDCASIHKMITTDIDVSRHGPQASRGGERPRGGRGEGKGAVAAASGGPAHVHTHLATACLETCQETVCSSPVANRRRRSTRLLTPTPQTTTGQRDGPPATSSRSAPPGHTPPAHRRSSGGAGAQDVGAGGVGAREDGRQGSGAEAQAVRGTSTGPPSAVRRLLLADPPAHPFLL
ncbi:hypothetical protein GGS23DRAFT_99603 [Durotheca rogersii]|uniref:uncharacterized protein n=1 Tax=Durotheca rogersii TaxID=419775 RepID=UPI0022206A04|nr:uncharacterized protein GGS23DRAFT_99603 [Durotheca rogersii]KAI5862417.1 hypothetical protein GGS23DRAFT_99603 [Durotheca rogersii]